MRVEIDHADVIVTPNEILGWLQEINALPDEGEGRVWSLVSIVDEEEGYRLHLEALEE